MYVSDTYDTEAYRKSVPADALPMALLDGWGGRTVMRNQLHTDKELHKTYNGVRWDFKDGILTAVGTAVNISYWRSASAPSFELTAGHTYLATLGNPGYAPGTGMGSWYIPINKRVNISRNAVVFTAESSEVTYMQHMITDGESVDGTFAPGVIDLTQWFGPEIAGTITDPEQAYALGVPREPMGYDPGTSVHAEVERVDAVESKPIPEAIRALPGYGESGSYVDVARKRYTAPDGSVTDISELLPADFDVLEVEAGGTVTFVQESGLETPIPSSITYMQKITANS